MPMWRCELSENACKKTCFDTFLPVSTLVLVQNSLIKVMITLRSQVSFMTENDQLIYLSEVNYECIYGYLGFITVQYAVFKIN